MLAYVASSLPYLFCKQPTYINTFAIDTIALECKDILTVLNILTLHLPRLEYILVNHYKDKEFITQVISTIGLINYNQQVEDVIYELCSSNETLDETVNIINTLVSYTDIAQLDVKVEDKPFLGHLFKLPISEFRSEEDMSEDALQWFINNYYPETLYLLLSHDMRYVSKELLQQLLDIAVRDHKYLDNCEITGFVYDCVAKHCDVRKSYCLISLVEKPLGMLINHSISGKKFGITSLDITRYQDRIWDTDIGKAFFAAHVNDAKKAKLKVEVGGNRYYKHLSALLQ